MLTLADRHDAYAADYDQQMVAYACFLPEALFGLSYEFVQPGQRLIDLGIGSGLAAAPFAKAGLLVTGMDFSPAMLRICRAKSIAVELRQQDLLAMPWPFPSGAFDHAVCCGVFHFIYDLEAILHETARVLQPGGLFAFTTKSPGGSAEIDGPAERQTADGLDIFSHSPDYVAALIERAHFRGLKVLRGFVGPDIFFIWVARKQEGVDESDRR